MEKIQDWILLYKKPLRFIFLGIIIILVASCFELNRTWFRWVMLSAAIAMVIGLVLMKNKSMEVENEQAPRGYHDWPEYTERWKKILHYGSVLLFIVGFLLVGSTPFWAKILVNENTTLSYGAGFGLLIVIVLRLILKGKYQLVFANKAVRKKELLLGSIGIIMNCTVLLAVMVIFLEPISKKTAMVPIEKRGERWGKKYVKVNYQSDSFFFTLSGPEFKELTGKDSLAIFVNEGVFGFEHVSLRGLNLGK